VKRLSNKTQQFSGLGVILILILILLQSLILRVVITLMFCPDLILKVNVTVWPSKWPPNLYHSSLYLVLLLNLFALRISAPEPIVFYALSWI
jgi:hypothetical protein